MVSGCVGFIGVFARTFGPSGSLTARFVRRVSRIFQVVSLPFDGAAWLAVRLPRLPGGPRGRTQ
jgi:hypothetical protein